MDVMIQVNVSGEDSKHGVALEDAPALAEAVSTLPALSVTGLMTVGLNSIDEAAVRAGAAITLALALLLAWRRTEPVAGALVVVAASLLLSPNVLPWYALWFVPLLVVRDEPAALLFTGTVSLAYFVYPDYQSGEPWKLGWGMRALEYVPCLLVFLLAHWRGHGRRAPS